MDARYCARTANLAASLLLLVYLSGWLVHGQQVADQRALLENVLGGWIMGSSDHFSVI